MTAIIALLLWEPVIPGVSTPLLGTIALWVAAILTLWSMFHYLRLAAPHFQQRKRRGARRSGEKARTQGENRRSAPFRPPARRHLSARRTGRPAPAAGRAVAVLVMRAASLTNKTATARISRSPDGSVGRATDCCYPPQVPGSSPGRGANPVQKWALRTSVHLCVGDGLAITLRCCPLAAVVRPRHVSPRDERPGTAWPE